MNCHLPSSIVWLHHMAYVSMLCLSISSTCIGLVSLTAAQAWVLLHSIGNLVCLCLMTGIECWLEILSVASPYRSSSQHRHHCLQLYDHPLRLLLTLSHPCISLQSRLLQQLHVLPLSQSSCSPRLRIDACLDVTLNEGRERQNRSKLRRLRRIDRASQGISQSCRVVRLFPLLHRRTQYCLVQSRYLFHHSRVLHDATADASGLLSWAWSLLYSTRSYQHFCSACHSSDSIHFGSITVSSAASLPDFSSPSALLEQSTSSSWSSLVSIAQHLSRLPCSA